MRIRLFILIGCLFFCIGSGPALAGPGHDHGSHSHDPIDAAQASKVAAQILNKLVAKNKLNKSWKNLPSASAETKTFSGQKEWVISFKNPEVNDHKKQTLYIFLTINGDYLAANFTGN